MCECKHLRMLGDRSVSRATAVRSRFVVLSGPHRFYFCVLEESLHGQQTIRRQPALLGA